MKVKDLVNLSGIEAITTAGEDNEVKGVYACDLLSRVMSSCKDGDVWITVQTHKNILTVAELNNVACIIVPEDITVNSQTAEQAWEKGISILSAKQSAYELCVELSKLV